MTRLGAICLAYEMQIRGWDQRRLALKAGLSEATVSRALRGERVRAITALQLAAALPAQKPVPELVRLIVSPSADAGA